MAFAAVPAALELPYPPPAPRPAAAGPARPEELVHLCRRITALDRAIADLRFRIAPHSAANLRARLARSARFVDDPDNDFSAPPLRTGGVRAAHASGSLGTRRLMSRGRLFTTDDASLADRTRELDAGALALFPQFFDNSASSLLVLRPDEGAGRGVELADGARLPSDSDTVVSLYFGVVRIWESPGDYVLALTPFWGCC